MKETFLEIVAAILDFRPVDGNWLPLDSLVTELWQAGSPGDALEDLMAVFERFPEEDGAGVFWTILHGLESLPGYERALVRSVQRHPSEFGVLMVGRLLNAGEDEAGGVRLLPLLRSVASQAEAPERARHEAAEFVTMHSERP